jgi:hypothetical protein
MHDEGDDAHFRLTIALMLRAGLCRACEIERVFGVTHNKVVRARRQLAERGERSFFERRGRWARPAPASMSACALHLG